MTESEFDATRLIRAWSSWDERPGNDTAAAELVAAAREAADALGVSSTTLVWLIQAERREHAGPHVAESVNAAVDGLGFVSTTCAACGTEMPDYQIYRDFHGERCPGPRHVLSDESRTIETLEGL